jgi:mRNA-degrading endonuclease RelE of RelBE toxin-antitoxin system
MKWTIEYSRDAEKFIEKQNIRNEVREELKKFLMKIKGENINIDLKKLGGEWEGYYGKAIRRLL